MSFTKQDHDDLASAAVLVHAVLDRHPSADLRVMSALCAAVQELRLAERYDSTTSTKD